jgi:fumarylacetoacetate (FAA) hydrolase
VVPGDPPLGTTSDEAWSNVKLMMLCDDVTLRNLIPPELAKSFGFFNRKPATALSPFAIIPDDFGDAPVDGRVHLNLKTTFNGEVAGDVAAGPEMHFSFNELIEHIAQTRDFVAGTILGSGTVSNRNESAGVSCLAERRMREIIADGEPSTRSLEPGDRVEITMRDEAGSELFGTISQRVVQGW